MNKFRVAVQTSIFAVLILATCSIASAQATRTWVSGVGDDVNPCSRTAPCKTFAGAISKTAVNGEINCLDPAGYGAVTVTKSITIDCEDTQGSILSAGTNGVIVNITAATDLKKSFKLRGVSINGAGTGINGIRILSALNVTLQEVVIDGVTTHGVTLENSSGNLKLLVDHTTIRSLGGNGINSFPIGTGTANVTVVDSTFAYMTGNGVNLANQTTGAISDTAINGVNIGVNVGAGATAFLSRCTIFNNTTGVAVGGAPSNVRLFGSTITGNGTGLSGSTITSVTNTNTVTGNTVDGAPTAFAPPI
jgi:hypothetical protein